MEIYSVSDSKAYYKVYDRVKKRYEVDGKKKDRRKKYKREYADCVSAFDIETTLLNGTKQSIMYIWQWAFEDVVIIGRTWQEWQTWRDKVCGMLDDNVWLVCYVHNLSFEFQFLAGQYNFQPTEVFAMDSRKVCKCDMCGKIEFRCSYIHSNMSLSEFCRKMGVEHEKLKGFDYDKKRFPDTPMTDAEIAYCVNDVAGLVEALKVEMEHDGDNLQTIPLTSTGYVRRDVKKAVGKWSYFNIKDLLPDYDTYLLLRRAFRGGNTHANRFFANRILENVKSCDRSSSYPDVICNRLFPMSKFTLSQEHSETALEWLINVSKRACVFSATFKNLCLNSVSVTCPYISRDKCEIKGEMSCDNGRVMYAEQCTTAFTDIDWQIVKSQYQWANCEISELRYAKYGRLPKPIIQCCLDYYRKKTELKGIGGQEIYYMKAKNKLNSIYGMMATDPIRTTFEFLAETDEQFLRKPEDYEAMLEYANKKAFLAYQWGVWTTAHARAALQIGIDSAGEGFVYADTDSVKYLGNIDLSEFNAKCVADDTQSGAYATDKNGEVHYMGVYEQEESYTRFITMGAKKYAYEHGEKLGITVSGVPKRGADELIRKGGLEAFRDGFTFADSGKLEVVYNDNLQGSETYTREDGKVFEIPRNVSLLPTTYRLGLTGEYERLIENPDFLETLIKELQINTISY